jgi:pyruvate kinase
MVGHTDEMIREVDKALAEGGRVAEGDRVVIVAGSPPGVAGQTNMIRVPPHRRTALDCDQQSSSFRRL